MCVCVYVFFQVCDYCDPKIPEKNHPPENAIDGTEAWWQSPPLSRGMKFNEVNLTINFEQVSSNNRQKKTKKKGGVAWERRKRTQDNTKKQVDATTFLWVQQQQQHRGYGFDLSSSLSPRQAPLACAETDRQARKI